MLWSIDYVKPAQALRLFYLSLEGGGSELVLKNFERVSSIELKASTVETWDEEARILDIYRQTQC